MLRCFYLHLQISLSDVIVYHHGTNVHAFVVKKLSRKLLFFVRILPYMKLLISHDNMNNHKDR